jgi:ubiquitin-like protein Pup
MAEQERIQKTRQQEVVNAEEAIRVDASRHDQLKNDLDELLDEIDEVLEDNAEEFVRGYVQKGGQ